MFSEIILNNVDQIHFNNYIIYVDQNKILNTLMLRFKVNGYKESIEFAKLPLNETFKLRLNNDFIYVLENERLVLIFYISKLIKVTNIKEYSSPLILKRTK